MTTIIAIDPGVSGGIAWNSVGEGVQACGMPRDEEAVVKLLREILEVNAENRIAAYIELVTGYVKIEKGEDDRENRQPGHTMFKFGRGVGVVCGALRMAGIEPVEVSPRTWQKPFYVSVTKPSGQRKSRSERKRILHDIAQRRFPQLQVTLKTADALLIHAYAGMQVGQELEGLEKQERPAIPVAFTDQHTERFDGLKRTVAKVPGNGSNPTKIVCKDGVIKPCNSLTEAFYIANWDGISFVMARANDDSYRMLRQASPADLINFPKLVA
jgi:hypothetical protein